MILHSQTRGHFYDTRSITSKRTYLQAVLMSGELFKKAVTSFPSNKHAAFYTLLMRTEADVPDNLTSKQCKSRLALVDAPADTISITLPQIADHITVPPPQITDQPSDDPDIDGGDGVLGPFVNSSAETARSLPAPLQAPRHVASVASDDEVDGEDADVLTFPTHVCGVPIKRESHNPGSDDGLRVFCDLHADCNRFRSLRLDVTTFGHMAPVYYLGTWLRNREARTRESHRGYLPTHAEVRSYIRECHP
jgi:hypothetical protein